MDPLKEFLGEVGMIPEVDKQAYKDLEAKVFAVAVNWQRSTDAKFPVKSEVGNHQWKLRINDFPVEEYKYTLFVDDRAVLSFNKPPSNWTFPG